jgi:protein TonB
VGSVLGCSRMVRYARPIYPKEAKRQHIQGKVKLRAVITVTGELRNIEVLEGDPVFVPAALRAVKRWRYAPCLLYGDAVELKTYIEVPFTLTQ